MQNPALDPPPMWRDKRNHSFYQQSQQRFSESLQSEQRLNKTPLPITFANFSNEIHLTPSPQTSEKPKKPMPWKPISIAVSMFGAGLLLHRLPASKSSFQLVSSDWKDWARMALSVGVVDQINKAFEWKPEPWQLGLQTVTAITAISNGFTKKGWKQFPLLALFIPALVQGTHHLNEFTEQKLKDSDSAIPSWIPKILISGTSTLVGIFALRNIIKTDWYSKLTGKTPNSQSSQIIGAEAVVCTRCGAQHLICMSELGDMLGSFALWIKGQH